MINPVTIVVRSSDKGQKFFLAEPWPDEILLSDGFMTASPSYLEVSVVSVRFEFENGKAHYWLIGFDKETGTHTAKLGSDFEYRPMTLKEAA